jgi:hypothetical protein
MPDIPDNTRSVHWIIDSALTQGYGHSQAGRQITAVEIGLIPSHKGLSSCSVFHWDQAGSNVINFITGSRINRCQYLNYGYQQYWTEVSEYQDLTGYAVSLRQAQTDHSAHQTGDIQTT